MKDLSYLLNSIVRVNTYKNDKVDSSHLIINEAKKFVAYFEKVQQDKDAE